MSRKVQSELQCRLCLQRYPDPQLVDIFNPGSEYRMHIQRAVFVHVFESDFTTRLCNNCRIMVDLIVSFQWICKRADDSLLTQEGGFNGSSWKRGTKAVERLWKVVETFRKEAFDEEVGEEVQEVMAPAGEEHGFELVSVINDQLGQRSENSFEEVMKDVSEIKEENLSESELPNDCLQPCDKEQPTDDEEWKPEPEDTPKPRAKRGRPRKDKIEWEPPENEADESESDASSNCKPKRQAKKGRKRKPAPPGERTVCDTCGQIMTQQSLEGHINRHLGVKPYVCDVDGCGRQCYSKYNLQVHRHLHKSLNRYYDCEICHKRLKGTGNWHRHKMMHTEQLKHSCAVCGKMFRRRYYLKLHSVVHTGVTNFPCEICGKRFGIKHNLGAHYKMHAKRGEFREDFGDVQEPKAAENQTTAVGDEMCDYTDILRG